MPRRESFPDAAVRRVAGIVALFVFLDVLVAAFLVRSFDGPFLMPWDPGHYLFVTRYFAENVHWLPVPHLDLDTNWTAYPRGTNHVFLHWSFERDALCSLLTAWFGFGPWFQLYFLGSLLVTAVGCFALARRDLGDGYAALVALSASFANFAVVREFPLHLPSACVHWSAIGMVADFVLAKRYWLGNTWSVRLVLARVTLLLLALGLDPGYVAGCSFTSFTLLLGWIAVDQLVRRRGNLVAMLSALATASRRAWAGRASSRSLAPVLVVAVAAAWSYLPLALQIVRTAAQYDFSELENPYRWAAPGRVLVPFLPTVGASTMRELFQDDPESVSFDLRPGATFVLLALLAVVRGTGVGCFVPFVVLVMAGVFFHPVDLPTLKIFPWFAMARVPGRFTFVLPIVFTLFATSIPAGWWRRPSGRVVAGLVAAFFSIEAATVYAGLLGFRSNLPGTKASTELLQAMRTIRATPGEALLEWPMSAVPSTQHLGVFHSKLAGAFQLAYLHRKKMIGFYFGRAHPRHWLPLLDVGWSDLLFPNTPNAYDSTQQRRDFTAEEWRFMERFFVANDFAGVLLYADLLPPATLAGFRARFGEPSASAYAYPPLGRIEFIPKRAEWRGLLDREAGARMRFEKAAPALARGTRLHLGAGDGDDYLFGGWAIPASFPRWTVEPEAVLGFTTRPEGDLRFRARVGAYGPQHVTVRWNGTDVGSFDPPMQDWETFDFFVPANLVAADNRVVFAIANPSPQRAEDGVKHLGIRVDWIEID